MYYSTNPGLYLMDAASMNSYFEQSGFYGQTGGPDQAYRFPLGLAGMGVSPYSQHQARSHQDSYDAAAVASVGSVAASPKAAGLYSPLSDSTASLYKTSSSSAGSGGTPVGECTKAKLEVLKQSKNFELLTFVQTIYLLSYLKIIINCHYNHFYENK